jgi:tRNA modification GTPase
MLPQPEDTIVALATATGAGARAIVRLSGPQARAILTGLGVAVPAKRSRTAVQIALPEPLAPLPTQAYFWPAPHTATGQDVAELHTLNCAPLVETLIGQCLAAGARAAVAGEFTLRAFLAGKRDLPQAEAVLGVIEANNRDELQSALKQLAGGVTQPLAGVREDLKLLLADVEAALDFSDEDISFVSQPEVLQRITTALAKATMVERQLRERTVAGRVPRVVLVGPPNAGKSSLFNALAPTGPAALVSPIAGTTRDYLTRRVEWQGVALDLLDTAGWQTETASIEQQAQQLGQAQAELADVRLVCWPADAGTWPPVSGFAVATKCDLAAAPPGWLATSAPTGQGLDELRRGVVAQLRPPALAPSQSRCQHQVADTLKHLRQAHQAVLFGEPAEILALELRLALEALGALVGAVYTDELLDTIFSRFCIGK